MKILVSGGCKNGKSSHAERLAVRLAGQNRILYYIATMIPQDEEDSDRIKRHRNNRKDMGFFTVEKGRDILQISEECDVNGTFLVDSTTALLANEMFPPGEGFCPLAGEKVERELLLLSARVRHLVVVSDYIYSDACFYEEQTEHYRKSLAGIDKSLAGSFDVVMEVCAGGMYLHKGAALMEEEHETDL